MATQNRTSQLKHALQKLRNHFQPVDKQPQRTVLEHLVYACCLENSNHEEATKAFEELQKQFFDWNEVRVSSVRELAESLKPLTDPEESATRVKKTLQNVFESIYSFDLEFLTKENLSKASDRLDAYPGTSPFVVAYVIQNALGGHAIPVNRGLLLSLHVLSIISDGEFEKGVVPGFERSFPKTQGPEVAGVFHQLGVLAVKNPYSSTVKKILLEIEPSAKDRLPKRPTKEPEPVAEKKSTGKKKATKKTAKKTAKKKVAKKKATKKASSAKGTSKTKNADATKKSAAKKKSGRKLAKSKPR